MTLPNTLSLWTNIFWKCPHPAHSFSILSVSKKASKGSLTPPTLQTNILRKPPTFLTNGFAKHPHFSDKLWLLPNALNSPKWNLPELLVLSTVVMYKHQLPYKHSGAATTFHGYHSHLLPVSNIFIGFMILIIMFVHKYIYS